MGEAGVLEQGGIGRRWRWQWWRWRGGGALVAIPPTRRERRSQAKREVRRNLRRVTKHDENFHHAFMPFRHKISQG